MVWRRLHGIGSSGFVSLAIAAMDIALWDIQGKARGLPLFRLLGGHRESVPVYGSGINLYYTMDELLDQVRGFLSDDVHGVKIKVGRPNLSEDLERIAAVRELIGPQMPLMLDANQGWHVGEAINRARAFEVYNPFWLEEPILADDHIGYETLARSISIPIATGETHYTRFQFADLFRRCCAAFVQADVYRVGGITEWMKIAQTAQSFNLPMCPHGMEEIHAHLTCAVSNGYIVEHVVSGGKDGGFSYLANPLELSKGFIAPRETPGHGVIFDEEVLSRCIVG
jgi:L-alanine-DL-glutamate epimerase-like enolase superfamily enzyme